MKGVDVMDKEKLISFLKSKPDLNLFVDEVIQNTSNLNTLFEIVYTETSSIKYACSKIIRLVSEQRPDLIYPYFENVVKWLHHKNSFIKWDGIMILSCLSVVDHEDRFKAIFQDYFGLIHDPQMITAANVIGNAWKIVLAKPELESQITRQLLNVPNITYLNKGEPSPECNCIVCGQVLDCFEKYFDHSEHQSEMINFAKGQLDSPRKSAAIKAEKFIKNHVINNGSKLLGRRLLQ